MALVNLTFTRMLAERKNIEIKGFKTKQDFLLKKVEINPVGKTGSDVVVLTFKLKVSYDPDMAVMELEGRAVFTEPPEQMKIIKENYEKKKKLPAKWGLHAMNVILLKSNLKLLELVQDINVPPHIQLPVYGPGTKKSNDYIG